MNTITSLKTVNDNFQVEYEVLSPIDISAITDSNRREIALALQDVDKQISLCEDEIAKLSAEIDKLTNHADGMDYAVAVASGILTGLIDSFFVGEFSLSAADEWGNKKVEEIIKKVTKNNDIKKAIQDLEKNGLASDSVMSSFGHTRKHHLNDFAHHPTLTGLIFSFITQFTSKAYGTDDKTGAFKVVPIDSENGKKYIGKNFSQKITFGVVFWFLHMLSDMAGSTSSMSNTLSFIDGQGYASIVKGTYTNKVGTGLPGPILSLAKELSALPIFKNKDGVNKFSDWISKLFNEGFDFRREIGIVHELGKQAFPVVINECLVRGFYFVRRLCQEIKENNVTTFKELDKINWQKAIPFGNRTVERMMTIASGTFTTVDMADAAIRGAVNSGGTWAGFAKEFILRVNFVGIGRFAIAVGVDVGMGIKRNKLRNERMDTYNQMLALSEAKVYYLDAGMWCSAIDTGKTLEKTMEIAENSVAYFAESWQSIEADMQIIGEEVADIVDFDSDFAQEILDELDF